jgi:hypothetical protein
MNDPLEIKSPWRMVWMEYIDDFIEFIRKSLPPDHKLQSHELFPGIIWSGKPIFIVDDDTTGEYLRVNFEKTTRWQRSRRKIPTIIVLKTREEFAALVEKDHHAETLKWKDIDIDGL